jgi:hypothetical protein
MMNDILNQLRANVRLRVGLALIIAMGWLYGVLTLRDEVAEQTQRFRSSTQSVARLKAQLTQPEWGDRAVAARATAVQLEAKLWQAPTPGLAQAALQDWLMKTVAKVGIANPQVTVAVVEDANVGNNASPVATDPSTSTDANAPADLWKLKAKLNFEFNPSTLMDFLAALETNDQQITVHVLTARKDPAPRAEMELIAYFQKQKTANGSPSDARAKPPVAMP